jgi:uncharacterized protein YuzE
VLKRGSIKKMKSYELKYNYDYNYDLLDMTIKDEFKFKETIEIDNGVYLDFDENNTPVSLEMISASKILGIDKKNLIAPAIEMFITVSDELICVELDFEYLIHNKSIDVSVKRDVANDYNLPKMEATLSTA